VACGTNALLPPITASGAQLGDNIAYDNAWTGTLPTACVSNPPAAPRYLPFSGSSTKTLRFDNATSGGYVYLTLVPYSCQDVSGAPTTYQVRYTRVGGKGQVYSDYMLNLHAPIH
jgi:hypothetical protein